MILRRVTQHVKDQNWFAVGLDFVIVVVGVFIGIQVANWNVARGEDQLAQRYIEQLTIDLQAEVADIENYHLIVLDDLAQRATLLTWIPMKTPNMTPKKDPEWPQPVCAARRQGYEGISPCGSTGTSIPITRFFLRKPLALFIGPTV